MAAVQSDDASLNFFRDLIDAVQTENSDVMVFSLKEWLTHVMSIPALNSLANLPSNMFKVGVGRLNGWNKYLKERNQGTLQSKIGKELYDEVFTSIQMERETIRIEESADAKDIFDMLVNSFVHTHIVLFGVNNQNMIPISALSYKSYKKGFYISWIAVTTASFTAKKWGAGIGDGRPFRGRESPILLLEIAIRLQQVRGLKSLMVTQVQLHESFAKHFWMAKCLFRKWHTGKPIPKWVHQNMIPDEIEMYPLLLIWADYVSFRLILPFTIDDTEDLLPHIEVAKQLLFRDVQLSQENVITNLFRDSSFDLISQNSRQKILPDSAWERIVNYEEDHGIVVEEAEEEIVKDIYPGTKHVLDLMLQSDDNTPIIRCVDNGQGEFEKAGEAACCYVTASVEMFGNSCYYHELKTLICHTLYLLSITSDKNPVWTDGIQATLSIVEEVLDKDTSIQLRKFKKKTLERIPGSRTEGYLTEMQIYAHFWCLHVLQAQRWGGDFELQIICSLFNVSFDVVECDSTDIVPRGREKERTWTYRCQNKLFGPIEHLNCAEQEQSLSYIIARVSMRHFLSLRPVNNETAIGVQAGNEVALSALALAASEVEQVLQPVGIEAHNEMALATLALAANDVEHDLQPLETTETEPQRKSDEDSSDTDFSMKMKKTKAKRALRRLTRTQAVRDRNDKGIPKDAVPMSLPTTNAKSSLSTKSVAHARRTGSDDSISEDSYLVARQRKKAGMAKKGQTTREEEMKDDAFYNSKPKAREKPSSVSKGESRPKAKAKGKNKVASKSRSKESEEISSEEIDSDSSYVDSEYKEGETVRQTKGKSSVPRTTAKTARVRRSNKGNSGASPSDKDIEAQIEKRSEPIIHFEQPKFSGPRPTDEDYIEVVMVKSPVPTNPIVRPNRLVGMGLLPQRDRNAADGALLSVSTRNVEDVNAGTADDASVPQAMVPQLTTINTRKKRDTRSRWEKAKAANEATFNRPFNRRNSSIYVMEIDDESNEESIQSSTVIEDTYTPPAASLGLVGQQFLEMHILGRVVTHVPIIHGAWGQTEGDVDAVSPAREVTAMSPGDTFEDRNESLSLSDTLLGVPGDSLPASMDVDTQTEGDVDAVPPAMEETAMSPAMEETVMLPGDTLEDRNESSIQSSTEDEDTYIPLPPALPLVGEQHLEMHLLGQVVTQDTLPAMGDAEIPLESMESNVAEEGDVCPNMEETAMSQSDILENRNESIGESDTLLAGNGDSLSPSMDVVAQTEGDVDASSPAMEENAICDTLMEDSAVTEASGERLPSSIDSTDDDNSTQAEPLNEVLPDCAEAVHAVNAPDTTRTGGTQAMAMQLHNSGAPRRSERESVVLNSERSQQNTWVSKKFQRDYRSISIDNMDLEDLETNQLDHFRQLHIEDDIGEQGQSLESVIDATREVAKLCNPIAMENLKSDQVSRKETFSHRQSRKDYDVLALREKRHLRHEIKRFANEDSIQREARLQMRDGIVAVRKLLDHEVNQRKKHLPFTNKYEIAYKDDEGNLKRLRVSQEWLDIHCREEFVKELCQRSEGWTKCPVPIDAPQGTLHTTMADEQTNAHQSVSMLRDMLLVELKVSCIAEIDDEGERTYSFEYEYRGEFLEVTPSIVDHKQVMPFLPTDKETLRATINDKAFELLEELESEVHSKVDRVAIAIMISSTKDVREADSHYQESNRQISELRYSIDSEEFVGRFFIHDDNGMLMKEYSEVVPKMWAEANFSHEYLEIVKESSSMKRKTKFIKVPVGADKKEAGNVGTLVDCPKNAFKQRNNTCVTSAMANCLHYLGYVEQAKEVHAFGENYVRENKHAYQLLVHANEKMRKLFKKEQWQSIRLDVKGKNRMAITDVLAVPMSNDVKLFQLLAKDGSDSHCVCVADHWIFDSNNSFAFPLTKESLDIICEVGYIGCKVSYWYRPKPVLPNSEKQLKHTPSLDELGNRALITSALAKCFRYLGFEEQAKSIYEFGLEFVRTMEQEGKSDLLRAANMKVTELFKKQRWQDVRLDRKGWNQEAMKDILSVPMCSNVKLVQLQGMTDNLNCCVCVVDDWIFDSCTANAYPFQKESLDQICSFEYTGCRLIYLYRPRELYQVKRKIDASESLTTVAKRKSV